MSIANCSFIPLRRVARIINGGTPGPAEQFWGGDIPWATPVDLNKVDGGWLTTTDRTITDDGLADGSSLIPASSVVISSRAPIGYIANNAVPMAFNQGCKGILPIANEASARFLLYALQSRIDQLKTLGRGSTFLEVGTSQVASLEIPWTNYTAQARIADYLDHETAEIDSLCDDLQRLVHLTIERSQSQIHASLSKANGHRESVATTLGKVIHIEGGQVNPKLPDYQDFPLIAPNHIEARTGQITMVETAAEQGAASGKYFIPKGHVVYSKIRPSLMKAAIAPWDCLSSADMYGINSQTLDLTNSYILEYLLSPMFESYAVTMSDRVAMPKLNRETLRAAPFVLPPLEIQNTTISKTASIRNELITLRQDVRQSLSFARERRAALITAAVTGQIDVTARNKPAAEQLEDDIAQGLHREN